MTTTSDLKAAALAVTTLDVEQERINFVAHMRGRSGGLLDSWQSTTILDRYASEFEAWIAAVTPLLERLPVSPTDDAILEVLSSAYNRQGTEAARLVRSLFTVDSSAQAVSSLNTKVREAAIVAATLMQKACFKVAPEKQARICAIHFPPIINETITTVLGK